MQQVTRFLPLLWVAVGLGGGLTLFGQGSRADYDRALSLRERTAGRVFRARVRPHWDSDGRGFWYRNDLADGRREFVRVDAAQGARRPAFDHAAVAAALTKALGRPVEADRLPVARLEFAADAETVRFSCDGRRWEWQPASGRLTPAAGEAAADESLPADLELRPSRNGGEETFLTFLNRTGGLVRLFWLDTSGQRRPYGTLPPGATREQHTFAGHVWLVTDEAGRPLAVFEAVTEGGDAVIEGPVKKGSRGRKRAPAKSDSSAPATNRRKRVLFRDHNVWLQGAKTEAARALTRDGTAREPYRGPPRWSPDGRHFATLRVREAKARKLYLIESSPQDQLQPKLHSLDYPKPGDPLPVPRVALFDAVAGRAIPVSDARFTNAWSLTDFHWSPDGRELFFLYNRRGHQLLRVLAVNAEDGAVRTVIEETSRTFIDYAGKKYLRYLDATGEILWMSERDGWNHLYLYDARAERVKHQVTRGEWVVRRVLRVDEARRQVWFLAGGLRPGEDPYFRHLCRVNFDGTGLVRLTEGRGDHRVEFSPDRRWFLDTWSRVDQPPVTELRRSADGGLVRELERADARALFATGWRPPEPFVAKGRDGKTDIYGVIYRPSNFVPGKRYPVIEEIYAGPQAAYVPKTFGVRARPQALAELGFIVARIDGMGTSYRSKAFHDVCWKNLGDAGFPDRIAWLKAAAARYPELDLSRVGIYGGSAGGQNALRGLLAWGDFYRVGVADCGCHDNRLDKVWWNELWMGWPVGPEYAEQSNVTQAHRLQGKLLLIVGELDRNVDPSSTLQVVHALIQADKDFDLLLIPGAGHGSAETPYGSRRRMDFFVRHLLGVEPRWTPAPSGS